MNQMINRTDLIPLPKKVAEGFCPAPFFQLLFHPTGKISPCCWMRDYHLGDIQRDDVLKLWNGPEIRALRKEFLTGNAITCKKNREEKACHIFYDRFLAHIEYSEVCRSLPMRFDLRLNSLCNLTCKMCNTWRGPNDVYNNFLYQKVISNDFIANVKELNMLGGEPLIQNSTFELIDLVSTSNKDCLWFFTTNLNYSFEKIVSYLDKIRISCIQMSLDTLKPEVYKEIRKNGSFDLAIKNIHNFIAYRDHRKLERGETFKLQASMCVQKDNWEEIPAFIDYCNELGISYHFQFAQTPINVSLLSYPLEKQEEILSFLIDIVNDQNQRPLYQVISSLATCIGFKR